MCFVLYLNFLTNILIANLKTNIYVYTYMYMYVYMYMYIYTH